MFQDSIYFGVISYAENMRSPQPMWIWKKHKIDVETVTLDEIEKNVYIMRDDLLAGGTKSRAYKACENVVENELIYAGPNIGYAQCALPVICKIFNKKATIFIESLTNISYRARMLGVNIHVCPKYNLEMLQNAAKKYAPKDSFIVPFGLDDDKFVHELYENLNRNWDKSIIPDHVWCTAGSGTLLKVLYKLFPKAYFHVIQVGKKIWDDQLDLTRSKLYVAPQKFWESTSKLPPYPSIPQYDGKLWQFFEKEAGINLIWNVGSDVIDFTQ